MAKEANRKILKLLSICAKMDFHDAWNITSKERMHYVGTLKEIFEKRRAHTSNVVSSANKEGHELELEPQKIAVNKNIEVVKDVENT